MPIVGTTRLMKGCFLLHKKLESELGVSTDFSFRPDRYGPLDPKVYDSVDVLQEAGLINVGESPHYSGTEYSLTESGEEEARMIFQQELSPDERELISWVKEKHVLKSLPKLLSFVYNQYPETTKNSELV